MSLEALQVALASTDVNVRREAVAAAAHTHDAPVMQQLLVALGDPDWRVREEAVNVLGGSASASLLLDDLVAAIMQGTNVGLRNAAREVLRGLGGVAAPALIRVLSEAEPSARKFVVEALACGGSQAAFDALLSALRGDDPLIAVAAMDALAELGGEQAIAALRTKLGAGEPFERAAALDALVRLAVPLQWDELAPLLSDRVLRRIALPALGRCDDVRVVPVLVAALADGSSHFVAQAVLALSQLCSRSSACASEVVRLLQPPPGPGQRVQTLARGDDLELASAACFVLACARDPGALPLAIDLCARGASARELARGFVGWAEAAVAGCLRVATVDGAERASALELAAELCLDARAGNESTRALLEVLRAALSSLDFGVRHAALRALLWYAQGQDAPALLAHARDEELELAQLSAAALRALSERDAASVREVLSADVFSGPAASQLAALAVDLQVPEVFARMRSALSSDDERARVAALAGLARLGGLPSAELAVLALSDGSAEVELAALSALAELPIPETCVDALLTFEVSDHEVGGALARALANVGHAGDARVRARLHTLARSGSPTARMAALVGLARLADPEAEPLLVLALADHDAEVAKLAIKTLADRGGTRAASHVAGALAHPAWDVRRFASVTLGVLRASHVASAVRHQLEREHDEYVRAALREALVLLEVR